MKRRNLAWCVICGDKIVSASESPFDFPDEDELKDIGTKNNLIPFAYSAPMLPEDSTMFQGDHIPWTPIGKDYYPRIRVRIGERVIEDDFDTGAIRTFVSDALVERGRLGFWRDSGELIHLGQPCKFFSTTIPVSVLTSDGNENTQKMAVSVVDAWDKSPFTKVNKMRRCLLGRDLLHKFALEITLNSQRRSTHVRLLMEDEPENPNRK
jgi:hypothetical protein